MGTSTAFGGSGGKDAQDLRDLIADWLTDDLQDGGDEPGEDPGAEHSASLSRPIDLRPTLRLLTAHAGSGGGPGGGGAGRTAGAGDRGRSGGGAQRSVGGVSRTAGRAGALARAYASGDRVSLERAGLNYDELLALGDMAAVGTRIVEAAFDTKADGTIADDESREIAAEIVEWILEAPADRVPTPDEIVRRSIELIITDVTLTEVGDRIRAEPSRDKRRAAEREIRDAAEVYARQVRLTSTGASDREIAAAIESGIRELVDIFGAGT